MAFRTAPLLLSVVLLPASALAQTLDRGGPPTRQVEAEIERRPKVLMIGIDGLRPDSLAAAATPNLDGLIARGALSEGMQAVLPTSSGPNWSSMLTGVEPAKHGVFDNSFAGSNYDAYPHFFTRIKEVRPTLFTASFVHWTPIHTQIVSGADISLGNLTDAGVANQAASLIASPAPVDVVFLHFDDVDISGHSTGFAPTSPNYIATIETTDAHIGTVLDALDRRLDGARGRQEDWLVLVSTDHGGLGTSHGGTSVQERTTFFIASGGSAPPATTIESTPSIYDIPVTAMDHLGIEPLSAWDLDGVSILGTLGCPGALTSRHDATSGEVTLTWENNGITDHLVALNDQILDSVDGSTYVHTPDLTGFDGHAILRYELRPNRPGSACPTLETTLLVSTGDVRLAEDFEDYDSDAELTAAGWGLLDVGAPLEDSTWTVENPGGKPNPPGFDGRPSQGHFVISDSDLGGVATPNPPGSGMSHDLWSPAFDCSGLARVWLHFDCNAQLNNNGEAVFDVDVSTDPFGLVWSNVFRRVAPARSVPPLADNANCDGYFGRLHVDLTSLAAGHPQVRFRLRHFEPNWDWWIGVDNVLVDDVDPLVGGSVELLASEGFDAGIPASWTLVGQNTGTETWHTTDKGGRYIPGTIGQQAVNRIAHPNPMPDFAMLDSDADPDPTEDEYLITPSLDCSAMRSVYLHYESETILFGSRQEVLVSLDGGVTFEPTPVFTYSNAALHDPGEEPFYASRVLAVPAAAYESDVAFAFRYAGPGNAWWWAIDEVRVTGTPGP